MTTFQNREQPGPSQESVWDYPRPPVTRECDKKVKVIFDGKILAETNRAICVLETSHPPTYYLPPNDIDFSMLVVSEGKSSFCEWKGYAVYYDVVSNGSIARNACWSYPDPNPHFSCLKDHLCIYAGAMEACYVGQDLVIPQPGGFYGGWITPDVVGPFKGIPGSSFW